MEYFIIHCQSYYQFPDITVVHMNTDLGKWNWRNLDVSHLTL